MAANRNTYVTCSLCRSWHRSTTTTSGEGSAPLFAVMLPLLLGRLSFLTFVLTCIRILSVAVGSSGSRSTALLSDRPFPVRYRLPCYSCMCARGGGEGMGRGTIRSDFRASCGFVLRGISNGTATNAAETNQQKKQQLSKAFTSHCCRHGEEPTALTEGRTVFLGL